MKTENIAPESLAAALANAGRTAGWNFRDVPIRTVTIGSCTVYVVPAKLWAYWCKRTCEGWREQRHA